MNKEVKELIQKIEDVRDNPAILDDDGWCDNWMVMSAKECKTLLNYINQLEENYKNEVEENLKLSELWRKSQEEKRQLETNIDKVIKEIKKRSTPEVAQLYIEILERGKENE